MNYGVWYDDAQLARVALLHAQVAKKLKVKKIVIGECGHAHKSLLVVADRLLTGDLRIPRESSLTVLRDIVVERPAEARPGRNDFPVTLHDPCNMVRLMGIVEPQREILRRVCPQFREMTPHGVDNYCCGGGSGFAIMSGNGFQDWRSQVAGRKKLQQILDVFGTASNRRSPSTSAPRAATARARSGTCWPTTTCGGDTGSSYGGLVELIVNAMEDVEPGFIEWEWRS